MKQKTLQILLFLIFALILVSIMRLCIGLGGITNIVHWGFPSDPLIIHLRLNRVWVGMLAGSGLGVAGSLLQSLLRNPLASPDLMGLSAGAGFAVTLTLLLSGSVLSVGAASGPALIGATLVLISVYFLSQRQGVIDPVTMILIGVIVSVILGSATMLVASQMPDRGYGTSRWMMGHLREDISTVQLLVSSLVLLVVTSLSVSQAGAFDTGALSPDEARSVGLNLKQIRIAQMIGAGVLTTVSILLAGPIGFVGLVSPHIVRILIGPKHAGLLIGSALVGATMVVGADVVTRLFETNAGRVPIGVLTSIIGGPVFLVLLLKQRAVQTNS